MDEIVARYYIQQKDKNFFVLDEALASEEYGIGFRKSDRELMENSRIPSLPWRKTAPWRPSLKNGSVRTSPLLTVKALGRVQIQ